MRLELAGVSKSYDGQIVLDQVSIRLQDSHALVIIGPSGGGKTTLLRILAGLEFPDKGEVILNGETLQYQEQKLKQHRKRMGMVFQSYNLFPHLSALDNITLPLEKVHGYSKKEAETSARELLQRFQLLEHADKRPINLSGGQKQRVAIARAVAIKPRILLLDEPTSALDPEFTSEVLDMVEELRREKIDLILVTHEMGFARKAADHVLFMAEGRIVEEGYPIHIFNEPRETELRQFLDKVLKY